MAATLPFAHSRSQSALATPIHCSFLTLLDTPSTATLSPDSNTGSAKLTQHGYGAAFDVPKTATTGSRPSSPFLKRIRSLSSIAKRARRNEPVPPLPQRKAEFIALPPSPLRDEKGRRLSPAVVKAIVAQPAKSSLKQLERERARQREREIIADVHRQFATWSWASASGSGSTGNVSLSGSSVPDLTSDDSRGSSPTIDLDSDCDSDADMSCLAHHETAVIVTAARYTSALELPKRRKRPAPLVPPPASRFVRAIADVEVAAKHLSMASVASVESLFPTFAPASPGAPVLPPSPVFPLDPIKLARGPVKPVAPLDFAGVWQAPAEWDIRRDSAADEQEFVDLNPLPTPRVRGIRRLFAGRSARK